MRNSWLGETPVNSDVSYYTSLTVLSSCAVCTGFTTLERLGKDDASGIITVIHTLKFCLRQLFEKMIARVQRVRCRIEGQAGSVLEWMCATVAGIDLGRQMWSLDWKGSLDDLVD